MRSLILIMMITLLSCVSQSSLPSYKIRETIQKTKREFPGLLYSSAEEVILKERITQDPLLQKSLGKITRTADIMLTEPAINRELEGRRLLDVARLCLRRIIVLSFAYRMTGKKEYLLKAEEQMLLVASFTDWNPSHFLDTAELTSALAYGYDFLYHDLSNKSRDTIANAIIEKGLKPGAENSWWVTSTTNWNQVCHTGMTLGALVMLDREPELATFIIERAINNLPKVLSQYAPDGVYPEGPGYWNYGTAYNVCLLAALESIFKTDFGLADYPGFMQSSEFYFQMIGNTGEPFNYFDSSKGRGWSHTMFWFSLKSKNGALLWYEKQRFLEFLENSETLAPTYLAHVMVWSTFLKEANKMPNQALSWSGKGSNPVAVHRSGWEKEDTYIAVKGGNAAISHGHMDVGSFVLESQGVRWADDLGKQDYHGIESKGFDLWDMTQKSDRWKIFRLNNFSHNTLVFNNKLQTVGETSPLLEFNKKNEIPYTIINMTPAYKDQFSKAWRGIKLLQDKSILIQDELVAMENGSVRWAMLTTAEVKILNDKKAILKKDGKELILEILSPIDGKLTLFNSAKLPNNFDEENPGTQMIGFFVDCPSGKEKTLTVWFSPKEQSQKKPLIIPLPLWKNPQ